MWTAVVDTLIAKYAYYVVLVRGNETSAGWHFIGVILGLCLVRDLAGR